MSKNQLVECFPISLTLNHPDYLHTNISTFLYLLALKVAQLKEHHYQEAHVINIFSELIEIFTFRRIKSVRPKHCNKRS